ncbi:MAG: acyltransferase [Prevotellamassilia sp.]|nr:acyltransferase [Prevotellamassilia sp.]
MKQNSAVSNEKLQSDVIAFLRFPLIIGVVMIHVWWISTKGCESPQLYEVTYYLFKQILARIAVPMFFMFSGFLLFNKCVCYTPKIYLQKIKSRIWTLLIPYLIWNLITIVFENGLISNIDDFLRAFWNLRIEPMSGATTPTYPIAIQFWYIRDLMVLVLFSPVIYWLVKKFNVGLIITLGILWIFNWWYPISGFCITAVFFFSLGSYFSIHKKSFIGKLKDYMPHLAVLYGALIVPILILHSSEWTPLRRITILIGIAFTLSLTARMIQNGKWKVNKFISESSFFIFACHLLGMPYAYWITSKIIPLNSAVCLVAMYFAMTIVLTLGGLVGYYIMKKYLPKITGFITGGR